MPSPFPGMDPYLEEPGLWPDVHHDLISEMQSRLNAQLRPKYHVRVEERVYLSDENDPGRDVIIPDLRVVRTPRAGRPAAPAQSGPIEAGGLQVAEPIEVTTLLDDEIHEARLEVIDRAERRVVTVIEVLSPTNKTAGSSGRASYVEKRREVMTSPSHWVEIDLLRAGVPIYTRERIVPHDYLVHVSKAGRRRRAWVWPILLQQRLPAIPIPLRGGDPDASLDLQEVLNAAYDRGAYDLEVNYKSEPPAPPLTGANAEWASRLLREKGLA